MLEKHEFWSAFCRKASAMLFCLGNGDKKKHIAFTLTEMLIALVVVAILAVLILPVVTTRAQNKSFALSYESQVKQMLNSLTGLHVMENKTDFKDTMMFVNPETDDYTSTSGAFINKYMKVAKYCGNNNETPGCFAQRYYQYEDNDRKEFDISEMKGACALLKNGASICLRPQAVLEGGGVQTISGWLDLNGPKGPNVYGRDLRTFHIDLTDRVAYSEEDPVEITMPEEVVIPGVPNPQPCLSDPTSEACCRNKVPSGIADPCCPWYANPSNTYHKICYPDDEEVEEACLNHSITGPDDGCCELLNDPKCCEATSTSDYCCATANAGSEACCRKGIAAGTINLSTDNVCCTKYPSIFNDYIELCKPPCKLDEDANRPALGDAWRKGKSVSLYPGGNASYCCDYLSRRKEIIKVGNSAGAGPEDGCCMFEDVYDDKYNVVSSGNCCRLQKFPLTNASQLNELCCSWRFNKKDLDGNSWMKTHSYTANPNDDITQDSKDTSSTALSAGASSTTNKFDSCCPYALSQIATQGTDSSGKVVWNKNNSATDVWKSGDMETKVWQNCCSVGSLKSDWEFTPECCHYFVYSSTETGYGLKGLMDINPDTNAKGILRDACCPLDEFKGTPQCCSRTRELDGVNTFRDNEMTAMCCMPNSVYTDTLSQADKPSPWCCVNAGEEILKENHQWFWSNKMEKPKRFDGCCSMGAQTHNYNNSDLGVLEKPLKKYDKWLVNCCSANPWLESDNVTVRTDETGDTTYDNAADFVRGCCTVASENPARIDNWPDDDSDLNRDCCVTYGSSGDTGHSRNDKRWWSRCCGSSYSQAKYPDWINKSKISSYKFYYKDGGCCTNVKWVENAETGESCCTAGIDGFTGKTLREEHDEYWYSNCCNYDSDYKNAESKGKTGYGVYRSNCCVMDKDWQTDGNRLTTYGYIRTDSNKNQQTYSGEPFNKYCCDVDIAKPDEQDDTDRSGAPSENCCNAFVDNDGMVNDFDDKQLSSAYRGRCCRHYAGMREKIHELSCPELWICQANGTNSTDELNNPGYGLPVCCSSLKANNSHDIWRGACCDYPTDYKSNEDYRAICCDSDPTVDYTRENVANGSQVGLDQNQQYCCKPDIVEAGGTPSENCCHYFKYENPKGKNYTKDNDGKALSEAYQEECCALSTGAVSSDTDYCTTCSMRWVTGMDHEKDANAYEDVEWKQWNFAGCCKEIHDSATTFNGKDAKTYATTDTWYENCCNYVGESNDDINKYYGSHEKFREHCCNYDGNGGLVPDPNCSDPVTAPANPANCSCWYNDYNEEYWGSVSAEKKKTCKCEHSIGDYSGSCLNCSSTPDASQAPDCCEEWTESLLGGASYSAAKTACCNDATYKNAHHKFCTGCTKDPSTPATSACCTLWTEANIGDTYKSACCTAWGEDNEHKTFCCADDTFKSAHYKFCTGCTKHPDSTSVNATCCGRWKGAGDFNDSTYDTVKSACCDLEDYNDEELCTTGGCTATPTTPVSLECCAEWENQLSDLDYLDVKNACCTAGFESNLCGCTEPDITITEQVVSSDDENGRYCYKLTASAAVDRTVKVKYPCTDNTAFYKVEGGHDVTLTINIGQTESTGTVCYVLNDNNTGNDQMTDVYSEVIEPDLTADLCPGYNYTAGLMFEEPTVCALPDVNITEELASSTSTDDGDVTYSQCYKLKADSAVAGTVTAVYPVTITTTPLLGSPTATNGTPVTLTIASGGTESTGTVCMTTTYKTDGTVEVTAFGDAAVTLPDTDCPNHEYEALEPDPIGNCSTVSADNAPACCTYWVQAGKEMSDEVKAKCCEDETFASNNASLCGTCTDKDWAVTVSSWSSQGLKVSLSGSSNLSAGYTMVYSCNMCVDGILDGSHCGNFYTYTVTVDADSLNALKGGGHKQYFGDTQGMAPLACTFKKFTSFKIKNNGTVFYTNNNDAKSYSGTYKGDATYCTGGTGDYTAAAVELTCEHSSPILSGVSPACCDKWGESAIGGASDPYIKSACCGIWGEDETHKSFCCADANFKASHSSFCNENTCSPVSVEKADSTCCTQWADSNEEMSDEVKTKCCDDVEDFADEHFDLCTTCSFLYYHGYGTITDEGNIKYLIKTGWQGEEQQLPDSNYRAYPVIYAYCPDQQYTNDLGHIDYGKSYKILEACKPMDGWLVDGHACTVDTGIYIGAKAVGTGLYESSNSNLDSSCYIYELNSFGRLLGANNDNIILEDKMTGTGIESVFYKSYSTGTDPDSCEFSYTVGACNDQSVYNAKNYDCCRQWVNDNTFASAPDKVKNKCCQDETFKGENADLCPATETCSPVSVENAAVEGCCTQWVTDGAEMSDEVKAKCCEDTTFAANNTDICNVCPANPTYPGSEKCCTEWYNAGKLNEDYNNYLDQYANPANYPCCYYDVYDKFGKGILYIELKNNSKQAKFWIEDGMPQTEPNACTGTKWVWSDIHYTVTAGGHTYHGVSTESINGNIGVLNTETYSDNITAVSVDYSVLKYDGEIVAYPTLSTTPSESGVTDSDKYRYGYRKGGPAYCPETTTPSPVKPPNYCSTVSVENAAVEGCCTQWVTDGETLSDEVKAKCCEDETFAGNNTDICGATCDINTSEATEECCGQWFEQAWDNESWFKDDIPAAKQATCCNYAQQHVLDDLDDEFTQNYANLCGYCSFHYATIDCVARNNGYDCTMTSAWQGTIPNDEDGVDRLYNIYPVFYCPSSSSFYTEPNVQVTFDSAIANKPGYYVFHDELDNVQPDTTSTWSHDTSSVPGFNGCVFVPQYILIQSMTINQSYMKNYKNKGFTSAPAVLYTDRSNKSGCSFEYNQDDPCATVSVSNASVAGCCTKWVAFGTTMSDDVKTKCCEDQDFSQANPDLCPTVCTEPKRYITEKLVSAEETSNGGYKVCYKLISKDSNGNPSPVLSQVRNYYEVEVRDFYDGSLNAGGTETLTIPADSSESTDTLCLVYGYNYGAGKAYDVIESSAPELPSSDCPEYEYSENFNTKVITINVDFNEEYFSENDRCNGAYNPANQTWCDFTANGRKANFSAVASEAVTSEVQIYCEYKGTYRDERDGSENPNWSTGPTITINSGSTSRSVNNYRVEYDNITGGRYYCGCDPATFTMEKYDSSYDHCELLTPAVDASGTIYLLNVKGTPATPTDACGNTSTWEGFVQCCSDPQNSYWGPNDDTLTRRDNRDANCVCVNYAQDVDSGIHGEDSDYKEACCARGSSDVFWTSRPWHDWDDDYSFICSAQADSCSDLTTWSGLKACCEDTSNSYWNSHDHQSDCACYNYYYDVEVLGEVGKNSEYLEGCCAKGANNVFWQEDLWHDQDSDYNYLCDPCYDTSTWAGMKKCCPAAGNSYWLDHDRQTDCACVDYYNEVKGGLHGEDSRYLQGCCELGSNDSFWKTKPLGDGDDEYTSMCDSANAPEQINIFIIDSCYGENYYRETLCPWYNGSTYYKKAGNRRIKLVSDKTVRKAISVKFSIRDEHQDERGGGYSYEYDSTLTIPAGDHESDSTITLNYADTYDMRNNCPDWGDGAEVLHDEAYVMTVTPLFESTPDSDNVKYVCQPGQGEDENYNPSYCVPNTLEYLSQSGETVKIASSGLARLTARTKTLTPQVLSPFDLQHPTIKLSLWQRFMNKLSAIGEAIADMFREVVAKLFDITIATRGHDPADNIYVKDFNSFVTNSINSIGEPQVQKPAEEHVVQNDVVAVKNDNTININNDNKLLAKSHGKLTAEQGRLTTASDPVVETPAVKKTTAVQPRPKTIKVDSDRVAKLTKGRFTQGNVAYAEGTTSDDMVLKTGVKPSLSVHCCVPEHNSPTEECCKAFKDNGWKDFEPTGKQKYLSHDFKLRCCNNHKVCPEVKECTLEDANEKNQNYDNCTVLADTNDPANYAPNGGNKCCACLASYRIPGKYGGLNIPLKNDESWRKSCCNLAVTSLGDANSYYSTYEEETNKKIGLDSTEEFKKHCCMPTVVDGTSHLGSDGSIWSYGSAGKDERCCNYQQDKVGNSSDFCCGVKGLPRNSNWQAETTYADESTEDSEYRNQCCLKNNKYCSCKQGFDKVKTNSGVGAYSSLQALYNGIKANGTSFADGLEKCCANTHKNFSLEGEALWAGTCCPQMVDNSDTTTPAYTKTASILGTDNDNLNFRTYCCAKTTEGGSTYITANGTVFGTSAQDERCCNYSQAKAANSSSFCCAKRALPKNSNWQVETDTLTEPTEDSAYRNQCCLKENKYCSCKQAYDKVKSKNGETAYSTLQSIYNGLNLNGFSNGLERCCANTNKKFPLANEPLWAGTCCPQMIGDDPNNAKTASILGTDNNNQNFRAYCCAVKGTMSNGAVTGSSTQDERCCNYTDPSFANAFCCDKKANKKNTTGTKVEWEVTGNGNEASTYHDQCCSSVDDKYCTCSTLYTKYASNAGTLNAKFKQYGGNDGVTCCNDTYIAKSGEDLWKNACCPVAQQYTASVLGDDVTFRSTCCYSNATGVNYSCYYNFAGTCDGNVNSKSTASKDPRCCTSITGAMATDQKGSGNWYCCSNLDANFSTGQAHSNATRTAGCCTDQGIRFGGETDPACCTYNAGDTNAANTNCCKWRSEGTNTNEAAWTQWVGSISGASEPFRKKCCSDVSHSYCTCEYIYANHSSELQSNTDCCDALYKGVNGASARKDEATWKANCCTSSLPEKSRGAFGGALTADEWMNSCCNGTKSTPYYRNDYTSGRDCCTWRKDHSHFDRAKNDFLNTTDYDACCAMGAWYASDNTTYKERCCHKDNTTGCCEYMYNNTTAETPARSQTFYPGSPCCINGSAEIQAKPECIDRCTHWANGDGYYYDASGKHTITNDVKRACCDANYDNSTKWKSLCCDVPDSSGNAFYLQDKFNGYNKPCCSYNREASGTNYGRKTYYYNPNETGTCAVSTSTSSSCSPYGTFYSSDWYCSGATCSPTNSNDYNEFCCSRTSDSFTEAKLKKAANNGARVWCCNNASGYSSAHSALCNCGNDGNKVLDTDQCCTWWGSYEDSCCSIDSYRNSHKSNCCGSYPDYNAAQWESCCTYWGTGSSKLGSSTSYSNERTRCCGHTDFYNSNKNLCDCGPRHNSSLLSTKASQCCPYWYSSQTSAQDLACCRQDSSFSWCAGLCSSHPNEDWCVTEVSVTANCRENQDGTSECTLTVSPDNSSVKLYYEGNDSLHCPESLRQSDYTAWDDCNHMITTDFSFSDSLSGTSYTSNASSSSCSQVVGGECTTSITKCEIRYGGSTKCTGTASGGGCTFSSCKFNIPKN